MQKLMSITVKTAAKIALLLIICSALTFCNSNESSNLSQIEEALHKADSSLQNAINRKDLDLLLSFYAEDAYLQPTAEPIVKGKESIREE